MTRLELCPNCGCTVESILEDFLADYDRWDEGALPVGCTKLDSVECRVKVISSECSAEFTLANHFRNEKQAVVHAWNKRNYHNWTGDIEVIGL